MSSCVQRTTATRTSTLCLCQRQRTTECAGHLHLPAVRATCRSTPRPKMLAWLDPSMASPPHAHHPSGSDQMRALLRQQQAALLPEGQQYEWDWLVNSSQLPAAAQQQLRPSLPHQQQPPQQQQQQPPNLPMPLQVGCGVRDACLARRVCELHGGTQGSQACQAVLLAHQCSA